MHYVYIIYSSEIDKFYVGVSSNPNKRLRYHNLGLSGNKNAFTKRAKDWELAFNKGFESKEEALKFEKYIKSQKSRKYIEDLIENNVDW